MRTIAIINQKGGVGKTTTVANLGAALALAGKRVVVFDMDPQANLSLYLGSEVRRGEPSVYGILTEGMPIEQSLRATRTKNLRLVASHLDLSGAELELASTLGRETLLRDALQQWVSDSMERSGHPPADFVLLDCPPSLGLLSINALVAATEVMIAVQTEFFALQGLSKLVEVVQLLRRRMNPALTLTGIIPCLYDSRLKLAREVLAELRRFFPGKVFKTPIRSNVKLAESPSHGLTIFEYAPESNGASDYENLATLILAQDGHEPAPSTHPGPVQKDAQALELENAAKGLREIELPADGVVEELEEEIPEPADASHEDPDSVEPDPEFSEDEDSASTADAIRRRNDGVDAELAAYELPRLARPEPTHPVVRADGVHAPMPAAKLDSGAAPAASPEPRAQATLEVETLPAEEALAPEDEPAGGFEEAVTPPEIESTVAGPELKPTEAESVGIEVEASPSAEALHAAHAPQVPQNDPHEAAQAEKAVHATRAQQASLDYAPGKAPTVGSKATVAANDSEPVGFDSEAEVAQTVSRTSDAGLDPQASPDGAPEAEWNAAEPEAPADRDGEDATSLAESAEDSDLPEVDVPRPTAQAEPDPDPETPEPARGPQVAARIAKAPEKRIPPTPIYGHSAYLGEDRWTWRPLPNR